MIAEEENCEEKNPLSPTTSTNCLLHPDNPWHSQSDDVKSAFAISGKFSILKTNFVESFLRKIRLEE